MLDGIFERLTEASAYLRAGNLPKIYASTEKVIRGCGDVQTFLKSLETRLQEERVSAEKLLREHGYEFRRLELIDLQAPFRSEDPDESEGVAA
jgi:hypothetical protein